MVERRRPRGSQPEAGPSSSDSKRVKFMDPAFVGSDKDAEGDGWWDGVGGPVDDTEDLETRRRSKKQVKLDGYDSVSEEEGDEADDMFDEDKKGKKGKKEVKYMQAHDIEGQEWSKHDDKEEVAMEPFNMEEDLQNGDFDESGHYIRKKDEHEIHDSWMKDVSKSDIHKAKQMHERQEARSRALAQLSAKENSHLDVNTLYMQMINIMKPGETLPSALSRLGGTKKTATPSWKKKRDALKNKTMDVKENTEESAKRKKDIDELTALSDKVMSLGDFDIYEMTYEQIVRKLRAADLIDEDWIPGTPVPVNTTSSTQSRLFEYKWNDESEEIFGPFSQEEMESWSQQNFFKDGVLLRQITANTPLDTVTGFVRSASGFQWPLPTA